MPSLRYFDASYHRLDPSQPLPIPSLDGPVGLACPACFAQDKLTPMTYIRQLSTFWRVACGIKPPRGAQGHYYRSWSFQQLNHEISSVNAGNWPPIPYRLSNASTHAPGPPVQPQRLPPPMGASQSLIQKLFKSTATPPGSPKRSEGIICRGVGGRTSAHQPTEPRKGNKQCLYRSCASCCSHLGDMNRPCPAKGHAPKKAEDARQRPKPSGSAAPAVHPSLKRFNSDTDTSTTLAQFIPEAGELRAPALPEHRRLPPQSAQSGARIAKEMKEHQLARLFELRSEREQALARNQLLEADESKVVKVIAWLKSLKASLTPLAGLERCQSGIPPWPHGRQTIVPQDCLRLDLLLHSTYETLIPTFGQAPAPSSSPSPLASCSLSKTPATASASSDNDDIIIVREVLDLVPKDTPGPIVKNDLKSKESAPGQVDNLDARKMPWPDNNAPMSQLLEWYQLLKSMARLPAWDLMFKDRFIRGDRTVYRYAKWLDRITEIRLRQWEDQQKSLSKPVTIGALRQAFLKEYILVGCPPPTNTTSTPVGKKRNGYLCNTTQNQSVPSFLTQLNYHYSTNWLTMTSPAGSISNIPTSSIPTPSPNDKSQEGPDSLGAVVNESLSGSTRFLDSHEFGARSLPVTVPETPPSGNNVTMFAISSDLTENGIEWAFDHRAANISTTWQSIHRWDCRSTFKATLSRGGLSIPLGVRVFDHHQRALRTYLNIAQKYFHVSVQLGRFRDCLLAQIPPGTITAQELEALQKLRVCDIYMRSRTSHLQIFLTQFQENLVGLMHESKPSPYGIFNAFTAEELLPGHRDIFSRETAFGPALPPFQYHPLAQSVQLLLNTFSHWTYHMSGQESFITGFQGVGPVITEAVVHDNMWVYIYSGMYRGMSADI
ncbi:hypothetical protein DFH28DRAFT_1162955 [Melampsora americana]|nr:hypothetical protein DFH28DRAFT_1162955 [Melampsora americana]